MNTFDYGIKWIGWHQYILKEIRGQVKGIELTQLRAHISADRQQFICNGLIITKK